MTIDPVVVDKKNWCSTANWTATKHPAVSSPDIISTTTPADGLRGKSLLQVAKHRQWRHHRRVSKSPRTGPSWFRGRKFWTSHLLMLEEHHPVGSRQVHQGQTQVHSDREHGVEEMLISLKVCVLTFCGGGTKVALPKRMFEFFMCSENVTQRRGLRPRKSENELRNYDLIIFSALTFHILFKVSIGVSEHCNSFCKI